MAVSPATPVVKQMISLLTDEETLRIYAPPDDKAAEINALLVNHRVARELREDLAYSESRPHLKIPESMRAHSLTSGALAGPGKIEVPPLMFVEKEGKGGLMLLHLGTDICGHPGLVHGGAIATLLDETLARSSFRALPNQIGMTANLTINYRKPVPAGSYVLLRSKTVKVEGRKVWVEGSLESLPSDGEHSVTYADATALFVEPKQAKVSFHSFRYQMTGLNEKQAMAQLYPASS